MTKEQFESAKEIVAAINYLEKVSEILHEGDEVRIKIGYYNKENAHMSEIDLSYMDKASVEDVTKSLTNVIDNRLKVYNTRLEEI